MNWMFDSCLRPPRAKYDIGNTICLIENRTREVFIRDDVTFVNDSSETLHGSFWHEKNSTNPTSCIIFLHSLGTNQFECLNLVPFLCTPDLALFSFDFSGSGISEGDVIPLAGQGSQDVLAAESYLRTQMKITQIALWGRSMGAAIGLNTVSMTNEFICIVSDSAFASPEQIVYDQAKINGFPKFLIKMAEPYLRKEARKLVGPGFDVNYPVKNVSYAATPLFMGHGKYDTFVPINQARELFAQYGCTDKQLYIFDAKHNTARPNQWYEAAARFVYRKLGINQRPRFYDLEYRNSVCHIGKLEFVLQDYKPGQQPTITTFSNEHPIIVKLPND